MHSQKLWLQLIIRVKISFLAWATKQGKKETTSCLPISSDILEWNRSKNCHHKWFKTQTRLIHLKNKSTNCLREVLNKWLPWTESSWMENLLGNNSITHVNILCNKFLIGRHSVKHAISTIYANSSQRLLMGHKQFIILANVILQG